MTIRLTEALSSCAFTVAHPELDDLIAMVSGDYVTFGWLQYGPHGVVGVELDGSGPVQHGLGNDHPGGLHGADAADLLDTVRQLLWDWATSPEVDELDEWGDNHEEATDVEAAGWREPLGGLELP